MPIKISAGLSRKVGQANYGSVGASCHVDFEADAALLDHDLDAFQGRIKNAYVACAQAVNDELARQQRKTHPNGNGESPNNRSAAPTHATTPPVGYSHGGNGRNGSGGSGSGGNGSGGGGYHATEKQLKYLRQLAGQIKGVGIRRLEHLAEKVCGKPLAGLTSLDASSLIDTLKAVKSGEIDLDDALSGAPS